MKKVRYMISDAANMMQVESHVLRYWEEELELDVPRNEMGHRYYTEENMQQFRQIKKWKEEGYQLKAIKMMLHNENRIWKKRNSRSTPLLCPVRQNLSRKRTDSRCMLQFHIPMRHLQG